MCVFASVDLFAQDKARGEYLNTLVLRGNPSLLQDTLTLTFKKGLYKGKKRLTTNNWWAADLSGGITPTFGRFGLGGRLQPYSFIRFGGNIDAVRFFGRGRDLATWAGSTVDFDDDALKQRADSGLTTDAWGLQLSGTVIVQERITQRIAFRNNLSAIHHRYDLPDTQAFFYDPVLDVLIENKGLTIQNETDALYITPNKFIFGLRYSFTQAMFETNDFGPLHRLGPIVSYVFYSKANKLLDSATVFGLVNFWVRHPNRSGLLPMIALGLNLTGRLF